MRNGENFDTSFFFFSAVLPFPFRVHFYRLAIFNLSPANALNYDRTSEHFSFDKNLTPFCNARH